jgi:hypothetical protein
MTLVFQTGMQGCFAACCATLFGGTYEEWDCVGHHHPDWRERLREKTGLDYFEVGIVDGMKVSPNEGDIYIIGVVQPFGGKHVVLGRAVNCKTGEPFQLDIFHDPLGAVKDFYKVDAIIVLSKIFRMP